MKSRKFTDINLTETNGSSARGLLVARAPHGDVATAGAAVRRYELQHNQSPRFARRRQERRKGQALLLAVLIMLLAALLSAGFLAVVSGNLNQTARIADKTRAIEASRAGIAYANAQLSGSSQGDLWRPIDVSPAPAPGSTSPSYDFYYSQLDKVQGWAAKTPPKPGDFATPEAYQIAAQNYRDTTYGKFPDPNQPAADAPKFLVKVEELTTDSTAPDYDADHAGEIKITSIGLSDDDPNVFHRAVAYKSGRRKSPMASALRSVSNWRFGTTDDNTGVPYGRVSADVTANPSANVTVTIDNRDKPQFSEQEVPFNVVIVKKDATPTVRGAVVTAVATTGAVTTLTLAKLDNDIVEGEVIQKAAAIGVGSTIDLLNTGTPVAYTADLSQPNGILANGSMWLQGQIQLSDLSKNGTKLFTSGSLALDGTKLISASGDVTTAGELLPSNANTGTNKFPGTFVAASGVEQTDLVNDGWNKIGAQTLGLDYSNSRDVEPFKPVKLDNARNLARYRALTRNSADGIYIDNRGDVEKVGADEMTQAQLMEMWTSDKTTLIFARNGAAGGASLEEKHLRGWIGPDEFMARGALIELIQATGANPSIRVTYDARSDANFNGPDPAKTLRDTNGTLQPGVYSKNVAWPKNGTLFAEGNIRIRGKVDLSNLATGANAADFPSLTVVSQGNIYIEGGVSVDDSVVGTAPAPNRKKLMLLAKKNVVVNPTRLVLGHADEQTLATNTADVVATGTAPNQSIDIPVNDASAFKVGDVIETYDTTATPTLGVRGVVSARDLTVTPNTLTASLLTGTTVPAASAVKTLLTDTDKVINGSGASAVTTKFFKADSNNAIERRVLLQNAATQYPSLRLTLDHLAKRDLAFEIKTERSGVDAANGNAPYPKPSPLTVELTNKRVVAGGTYDLRDPLVISAEKRLRTVFNAPGGSPDEFPDPATFPFDDAATVEGQANGFSLADLETAMVAKTHEDNTNKQGWKYVITRSPAAADDIPFFALAGVGMRNDNFSINAVDVVTPTQLPEIGDATGYDIPVATSIRLQRNFANEPLTGIYTGDNGGNPVLKSYTVPYLGFNPIYGDADASPADPNAVEDVLTSDQSFYKKDDAIRRSTLDSRRPLAAFSSDDALVLRQNNDLLVGTAPITLPEYRVRSLKLENTDLGTPQNPAMAPVAPVIRPIDFDIDAYVYAQEGSWFVIPGDYFRTDPQVRTEVDVNGDIVGTYVDVNNDKLPDAGEFILDANGTTKVADLNRNGIVDPGESEAALRFVRYNYTINFYGAIVENQTAIVADVKDAAGTNTLAKGAVQDWMDKWAAYNNDNNNNGIADNSPAETDPNVNNIPKFKFVTYAYDPSLANGSAGANQLRVPVTDELLYQQ